MKAIILAAGYGTRLEKTAVGTDYEDYVRKTPKPLLDIDGKPLLGHIVDKLAAVNVDEVRIVSNNKFYNDFSHWLLNNKCLYDFRIDIVNDGSNTNDDRKGAVKDMYIGFGFDEDYNLRKFDDDCIVLAGDRWPDLDLENILDLMKNKNTSVLLSQNVGSVDKVKGRSQIRYGVNGKVLFFEEKPVNPTETNICLPFYFLKKEDYVLVKDFIKKEALKGNKPDAPGYFMQYLSKKTKLHAYQIDSQPFDFGTLNSYLEAKEVLEKR